MTPREEARTRLQRMPVRAVVGMVSSGLTELQRRGVLDERTTATLAPLVDAMQAALKPKRSA